MDLNIHIILQYPDSNNKICFPDWVWGDNMIRNWYYLNLCHLLGFFLHPPWTFSGATITFNLCKAALWQVPLHKVLHKWFRIELSADVAKDCDCSGCFTHSRSRVWVQTVEPLTAAVNEDDVTRCKVSESCTAWLAWEIWDYLRIFFFFPRNSINVTPLTSWVAKTLCLALSGVK